jgi:hypothetical protein
MQPTPTSNKKSMTTSIALFLTWSIVGFTQVGPNTCQIDLLTHTGNIETVEALCVPTDEVAQGGLPE